MKTMSAFALALAAGLAFTPTAPAQNPPALYGLSHITNESDAKATVYYKWGANGTWRKTVIEKGKRAWFSYAYDGASKSSPDLYVRIDSDTNGVKWVEYTVSRGQSPDDNSAKFGDHHVIKQVKGTDSRYIGAVTNGAVAKLIDAKSSKPNVP